MINECRRTTSPLAFILCTAGKWKEGGSREGHLNYSLSRKTFAFLFSRGCGFLLRISPFLLQPYPSQKPLELIIKNHSCNILYSLTDNRFHFLRSRSDLASAIFQIWPCFREVVFTECLGGIGCFDI